MKKTVLIVEDDALIAMDMESTLAGRGFLCRVAGNVASAKLALRTHKFDAAVLDWRPGPVDSGPIAQLLRAAAVPFIVCTGSIPDDLPEAFRGAPIIAKPFREDELVAALNA